MDAHFPQENAKFYCDCCKIKTNNKKDYNKHILTIKHKKNENMIHNDLTNTPHHNSLVCLCGKQYKYRQGLQKHAKKCTVKDNSNSVETIQQPTNELVMTLLTQNMELQKQIIELCKDKGTTINNTTNNSNTNNFNLQFFLNETCKDALNIDEFVNQIQLQLSDLDMIGKVGYVEGITKIFLRNLKALDVCKRPIHCSDLKREVLYIKDKGAWEKDNDDNVKIKKVIKGIEDKNIKQLPQWRAENPTHEDTETKKHMEYVHILIESMGGTPIEDDNKRLEKIIRNIAKEVVIDKSK